MPAISSRDEVAGEGSFLTLLAAATAKASGASFDREAVRKQVHQPLHGIYDAAGRTAELEKAAYTAKRIPGVRHVVVVDDFITRGSTMSRMAQAMKASNPRVTVHGIALGKTERRGYWGGSLTNDHVHAGWDDLWLGGERRYRERAAG